MNWIDIVWPAMGGVSLTLGLVHGLIWCRERHQPAHLMFGLAACSVAALAIFELLLMHAQTPQRFATVLRMAQLPVLTVMVGMVGFVLLHFRAGRPWLGWTACGLRAGSLVPALVAGGSLRFRGMELRQIELWGGATVTAPIGHPSLLLLLAQATELVLVLFLVDAIIAVRKRSRDPSERRRVTLVCGSMALFVTLASTWATLVASGWLHAPLMVNVPFLCVILVMGYELGSKVLHSTKLERQLHEARSDLRGSEQRLQLTADAVGLGLWTWEVGSDVFWPTGTGSSLLGSATDGRVDRETLMAHVHPDDREALLRARDKAIERTGKFECDYRLPQPDGNVRWVSARGRVEFDASEAPVRINGVIIDITERRQAEERFRLVVEGSPTAMLMVDKDGLIALANVQAERVFGYSSAELIGQDVDRLVPSHARPGHARRRANFLGNPRARPMGSGREAFGRRRDGSEVPMEITLTPISIEGSLFVLTSITDISERLRIEQEVAVQRDELAHLSRISLLGEVSGSLAHELNQPLTAVLSNAQAALRFLDRDQPDLDEVRDSLVQIVENDKRAGEVIRRLRAMLRKEQIEHQALEVNDVVQDVLRLVNSDLLNRNIATILDIAPVLPPVSGDRIQLQQVLLNLVVNACDAMAGMDADGVLTIRTGLAAGAFIEVSVTDTGRGIPGEDLERIFSPFVTSKAQGMGLGLAVCRTIIQSHRGSLRASNNSTGGATLHVLLPQQAAPANA